MKNIFRDVIISFCIAFITFYCGYLLNGSILYNDLYAQGLGFLDYFKDELNFLDGGLIYNWNIGLGDSTYSMFIYYLMSPFNIILYFFKGINMVDVLPIFMTIKIAFIVYFSSLYFKKVLKTNYRWIATLIYVSNYILIMYGTIHVMWLDTFAFLPLVLLGIEKIINSEKATFYIVSFWLLVITNYYLAALLILHIAIYGILRYIFIKGKKGVARFTLYMIQKSIVSMALSAFVLIPAFNYMLTSAKDINPATGFGFNLDIIVDSFASSFIRTIESISSIHVPLLAMIIVLPFYITNKDRRYNIYLIHIGILILALFSDFINYIFNLGYEACGGIFRYNFILNIYIALLVAKALEEIIEKKSKIMLFLMLGMATIAVSLTFIFDSIKVEITIGIIVVYMIILITIYLSKIVNKKVIVSILTSVLLIELFFYSYYLSSIREFRTNDYAKNIKNIIKYTGEKYGQDSRIEISDKMGVYNTYLSQNVAGVEGFHSLMKDEYRAIGEVFTDTAFRNVVNRLGGRNIISKFTGERYYVTPYKYCPYNNSKLMEKAYNYYIYSIANNEIKYFDKDYITNELPYSMSEKDTILYKGLYKKDSKRKMIIESGVLNSTYIKDNSIEVLNPGEYYLSLNYIFSKEFSIKINNIKIGEKAHFSKMIDTNKNFSQVYIGYLKKGDKIEFPFDLGEGAKLEYIKEEYIKDTTKFMDSINVNYFNRNENALSTRFSMTKDGYAVLPVVYDKMWQVKINNKEAEPEIVNGGFIAFNLESGVYNIEMVYKDNYIYIGIAVTILTLIIIAGKRIFLFYRRKD